MKKKILIVEDDSCIRELLVEAFVAEGFCAFGATNGFEALYSLEESIPDIILVDIMMPQMCGREFRKIQLSHPRFQNIPTISMSAQTLDQDEFKLMGFEHYIAKPLELNELFKKVDTLT